VTGEAGQSGEVTGKPTLFEKATESVLGEYADLNKPRKIGELSESDDLGNQESRASASVGRGPSFSPSKNPLSLKDQEREYLRQLLDHCKGDKRQAAQIAGLTLRTLYRKLEELDGRDD
jgi:DNA-binding NtrC family response regulator